MAHLYTTLSGELSLEWIRLDTVNSLFSDGLSHSKSLSAKCLDLLLPISHVVKFAKKYVRVSWACTYREALQILHVCIISFNTNRSIVPISFHLSPTESSFRWGRDFWVLSAAQIGISSNIVLKRDCVAVQLVQDSLLIAEIIPVVNKDGCIWNRVHVERERHIQRKIYITNLQDVA